MAKLTINLSVADLQVVINVWFYHILNKKMLVGNVKFLLARLLYAI